MRYDRELMPLVRVLLAAGDLLYIPCGWWHKAEARGNTPSPFPLPKGAGSREAAISLAVGVMSRSAMEAYDFLRRRLVESLAWRQRLPLVNGSAASNAELETTYRHLFAQLAADLARTMADPKLKDFLAHLSKTGQ
jgi:hypothetical protein